ncbi:aldehyde dehydrogenase family protein [Marinobacter xestospongiae]|uniref:aldehyde dehydrogenase family protein n=1 Tax=Marinobacter xestospongiae TaxID=994319 RepID=UPI0020032149|nr:aldehyde dehydrogenase family protein [Marinobacter xestospongiae]MCK7568576.1 aldehyde dehydrogenase family protein [Marinobacter xestospongiae]
MTEQSTLPRERWPNFVNGAWVNGSASPISVLDPATDQEIARQECASAEDVDLAVQAAKRCHQKGEFRHLRPVERGRLVQRMGQYLLDNIDEIASVLCLDAGKPLWEARLEIESAARYFEYYGNQAETLEGRSIPLGGQYYDFTVYEPYGVTAHIIPWNYPLEMSARSISAALATGNTCVVKTPELDPLSVRYIAEAGEHVGLPAGALNILCGYGKEAGAALSGHAEINQLVFTGSVPTGIAIAEAAARNVVPCVLELGGKSAALVFEDADIDALVEDVRWGIFFNAGQVCSALSRLIVHESIYDQVVSRVAEMANSLTVGAGSQFPEFGRNMGAMISRQQRDKAEAMCGRAREAGAIIAAGGQRLEGNGYFLAPTVVAEVTPEMEIARDEVFGPVVAVLKFRTEAEALAIANGTDYGLVGGVYSANVHKAMRVARDMRAGQIFVNEWYAGGVETPFGGYGKSGYGREKGREALFNYVQTKNIGIAIKE